MERGPRDVGNLAMAIGRQVASELVRSLPMNWPAAQLASLEGTAVAQQARAKSPVGRSLRAASLPRGARLLNHLQPGMLGRSLLG